MTTTQRVEQHAGFILHQYPYRDSSVLLEVFTQQYGKLGLIARGARSSRSKIRADLQPFRELRLSWLQRGDLGTLTQVESSHVLKLPSGDRLFSAYYVNELLMRLLIRHDPHPALYENYLATLEQLFSDASMEIQLRKFEKILLDALGYGLILDVDVETGETLLPDKCYEYHLEHGPVETTLKTFTGLVFPGSSLLAIAQGDFQTASVLPDAKRLMRTILRFYLGDQPLKTRGMFRQMK
ncbi:MAG: DNA repair protein RecO [Gammaproteobacteria bacterium]